VPLVLSPYPPTNPPTPLPPPSGHPRLVKQVPEGFTDSQLYDLFRPYGALASARTQTQFGRDIGMVEFWSEEDAQVAEQALHCADVNGTHISVQIYNPRQAPHPVTEFNAAAPSFVPTGINYSPFHPQVGLSVVLALLPCLPRIATVFATTSKTRSLLPSSIPSSIPNPDAAVAFHTWPWSESATSTPERTRIEQSQWPY